MNKTFQALAVALAFLIISCSNTSSEEHVVQVPAVDSTYAPVETKDPNSDYKPAFEGQTRVGG
ncbi:MAG TPA: hypothetical protein VKZ75_04390, partial [Cyclobacteriaceae bacterium]|nr:hypothetical protein [Cyclobacteriaceae bacterium]